MADVGSRPGLTMVVSLLCLVLLLGIPGCSPRKMMVRTAGTFIPDAMAAFHDEPDWELARAAGFSNLKLLETMHRASPEDEAILVALAQAFGGVALAFLEEDAEVLRGVDAQRHEEACRRAAAFYERGQAYAAQVLELRHPGLLSQVGRSGGEAADLEQFDRRDVPALFWYAFNQAGSLWLKRSEPGIMAVVPQNRRLALRLRDLDEGYFFGGPLILLAIFDAHLPPMFGGSLENSSQRFQLATEHSQGRFLLIRVLYAEHYLAAEGKRELFDRELAAVLEASPDILPGYRLFTTLAQRRARLMAQRADSLF